MRSALVFLCLFFAAASAGAEQDFYGIKMKNELWAKNLVLNVGPKADKKDLRQGPVLDREIFADARIEEAMPSRLNLRINVVNGSQETIDTPYKYRDYYIHTKDGKKIPLADPESQRDVSSIPPKGSKTFSPSLGNLDLRTEDIRFIECSFNMGATRIFLFPASKKDVIKTLQDPAGQNTKLPIKKTQWPVKEAKAPEKNFTPYSKTSKPKAQVSKTPPAVVRSDAPTVRTDQTPKTPPAPLVKAKIIPQGAPILYVLSYDDKSKRLRFNLGMETGVQKGVVVVIMRKNDTIARARVRRVQDGVATASLFSSTEKADIRAGDQVILA